MTRIITLLCFFILLQLQSAGQIDSLWDAYLLESDENRAKTLFIRMQGRCKKDFLCFKPITTYLLNQPPGQIKARTFSFLCSALQSSFMFKECILIGNQALREFNKTETDPKWPYLISHSLAMSYGHISKIDSALYYAEKSAQYIGTSELEKYAWRPDYARFNAYEAIKERDLSFSYLEKSYAYLKHSDDRMGRGFVLFELLRMSDIRKKSTVFDKYLKEYIQFSKEGNKKPDDIHRNLLMLFADDADATKILEEKIKNFESDTTSQMKIEPVTEKMKLVQLYTNQGNHEKAIQRLRNILSDSTITGDGLISNAYIKIIENFEILKKWDSAYTYSIKYNQFLNSRYQKNLSEKIAEFEVKYQLQQKENELQKQIAINAGNELSLRTSYGIITGFCILGLLLFLFVHNRAQHQKRITAQEQELQKQKIVQLEQDNKLLSLSAVIEGQELERLRIAQDLHDGLGGLLTTVKAHFNIIKKEIEHIEKVNVYAKTNELIDEACSEVRRIAHDMVPHSIKLTGLTGALHDLKESILIRGLDCELDIHGFSNQMLSEQNSNVIYRMLQELTTNTIKHARANKILIQLLVHQKEFQILVEDNGKGFDIHNVSTNGIGLKSVQSRVEYLGGKLMIDSSPSHGTTIHIQMNLEKLGYNRNDSVHST